MRLFRANCHGHQRVAAGALHCEFVAVRVESKNAEMGVWEGVDEGYELHIIYTSTTGTILVVFVVLVMLLVLVVLLIRTTR